MKHRGSWYNEIVSAAFQLPYPATSLAVLVISTPPMFTHLFLPWLKEQTQKFQYDADTCVVLHDYDIMPNRRPKAVMGVAGYVAGASSYYQRSDLTVDPWNKTTNIAALSLHPKYGGWFAFRGVLIFPLIDASQLERKEAVRKLTSEEAIVWALERFNFKWKDATYRDSYPVAEKYDSKQREYFTTRPSERISLLSKWLTEMSGGNDDAIDSVMAEGLQS
ncbi:unnamed protein product [Soboliphyme baturini]|uniref:Cyanocobalamin reductase (cyanide-eliminating) n=1 Tax=Soboliphyme baturini TaxID=241478 RepID=A0A183J3R3_9BILA|nr:unnamed protein product [Soboliphyme baturini]